MNLYKRYYKNFLICKCLCYCLLFSTAGSAQAISDTAATKATKALYKNLFTLSKKKIIFGHQDDLAYGVQWKYDSSRSDVKDVVGDYPGIYGWDLGHLELDASKNLDGIPFSKMQSFIKEGYARGAAITISWHFNNPLTGGSAWDTTHGAVEAILPGGSKHELYKSWLDKAAVFIDGLKGSKGEAIPVLFRPFHELTGNWFWWCRNTCSPETFKAAWRFTVTYLREKKQLHNLVIVYNTADFSGEKGFLERYPGDDVVDILSFDGYQFNTQKKQDFIRKTRYSLDIICKVARQKNKLAAFAETGYEAIPDASWWTNSLMPAIKNYPLSYVLVWRNAGYMPSMKKMHYYAPYPGQVSANDFKKMYDTRKIIFEKEVRLKKIYE